MGHLKVEIAPPSSIPSKKKKKKINLLVGSLGNASHIYINITLAIVSSDYTYFTHLKNSLHTLP